MNIAIDLLWVKHQQVGGIESYVRNLLDGLLALSNDFLFTLLVSKDNKDSFLCYSKDKRIRIKECPVISTKLLSTVIWENFKLDKLVTALNVDFCFVPYYRCPAFPVKNKYIIVLHDLNALHFPEYFSKTKYYWLKCYWKYSLKRAYKTITISDFCKKDILDHYKINDDRVTVIHNPIAISMPLSDFHSISSKYNIKEREYLYTVSSTYKHKNLITLLKMMKSIVDSGNSSLKLIISGIKGSGNSEIEKYILNNDLSNTCILTGFVSDEERNTLMKYARLFLFPSVFEGFGMPPIEAMRLGTRVITTMCASIPEVTQGKAIYVEDPYDENLWKKAILNNYPPFQIVKFGCYDPKVIAAQYINLFDHLVSL